MAPPRGILTVTKFNLHNASDENFPCTAFTRGRLVMLWLGRVDVVTGLIALLSQQAFYRYISVRKLPLDTV